MGSGHAEDAEQERSLVVSLRKMDATERGLESYEVYVGVDLLAILTRQATEDTLKAIWRIEKAFPPIAGTRGRLFESAFAAQTWISAAVEDVDKETTPTGLN